MSIHPTEIKLHQASRLLEIAFEDGARFELPCEYLRVFSWSQARKTSTSLQLTRSAITQCGWSSMTAMIRVCIPGIFFTI